MKNSVLTLKVIGGLSACLLAFGLVQRSNAETITSDGGRLGVLADDGLRFGAEATPIAGNTFSAAKAKSKKYKKTEKEMKSGATKTPKSPKAPKATEQKKQKQQKQKKTKKSAN